VADSKKQDAKAEEPAEPTPVWNTTTQGPLPEGREGVYEVVGAPDPVPVLDTEGAPVRGLEADEK
jgi:hypothetical protein